MEGWGVVDAVVTSTRRWVAESNWSGPRFVVVGGEAEREGEEERVDVAAREAWEAGDEGAEEELCGDGVRWRRLVVLVVRFGPVVAEVVEGRVWHV